MSDQDRNVASGSIRKGDPASVGSEACDPMRPKPASTRPLDGVTMVETYAPGASLALRLAGALAGRVAADLGAHVMMLESTEKDPIRSLPPLRGGLGTTFAFLNAGKKFAPPSSPRRAEILAEADVAILDAERASNLDVRPPIIAELSLFKPGIVPDPASAFTISALGGLLDLVGDPEREPLRLGGHQPVYAAGLAAFTGIAGALCRPKVAGRCPPETVQVSLLDTVIWLNWKSIPSPRSHEPPPTRAGDSAEWQVLRCADGWVALVYQEPDWPALCEIVDDPRLREPHLATRAQRVSRTREINRIIEERFLALSREALHGLALKYRLPIGPVWSPHELRTDQQTVTRGFLSPVALGDHETVDMPRLPVIWSGRTFPPGAVPSVGMVAGR